MKASAVPKASIIIVNYNGRRLLGDCLSALEKLNYPRKKFEVIVVDNHSHDDSVSYIKRNFPKVKVIESKKNRGFTGGNHLGYESATGEMIILLNSDVVVEKNWLNQLVTAAESESVGMVSSKLYFATPFIELQIKSKIIPKSDISTQVDYSPVGVIVEDVVCRNQELSELVWYDSGFYQKEEGDITTRWTSGNGVILLPFADSKQEKYTLKIHGYPHQQQLSTPVQVLLEDKVLVKDKLQASEVKQYKLNINRSQVKNFIWLVQNAGNQVLHDGHSKDRGSLIRRVTSHNLEFYERDNPYFNQPVKLLAVCGASCLIKRQLIDDVGFFDDYYFMYYEDLDLSLRAWRSGWDIVYAPQSIGYHQHMATTKGEDSAFFKTLIERNHLYFTLTHFPITTYLYQLFFYLKSVISSILMANLLRFVDNVSAFRKWSILAENQVHCTKQLFVHTGQLLKNKYYWSRHSKRNFSQARKMMY